MMRGVGIGREHAAKAAVLALSTVLALAPTTAVAATETQVVPVSTLKGNIAEFRRTPSSSGVLVSGQLTIGRDKSALTGRQLRRITNENILRIRIDRGRVPRTGSGSLRIALRLRIETTGSGAGPGEATPTHSPEAASNSPMPAAEKHPAPAPAPPPGERLYATSSPFNQPIPSNPAIDPMSSQMVQSLIGARDQKGFTLSASRWTVPTYLAGANTPRSDVALRLAPPLWGETEDFLGYPPGGTNSSTGRLPTMLQGVPIPSGAQPDPELDAHLSVIDKEADCEYDLYGAYKGAHGWQAVWANSTRLDGSGIYPNGLGVKASGFAGDAGLIWPQELKAGHIDHALFFAYPFTKSGGPVSPATSSDGRSTIAGAIPEGARVQLDPSLNLDSLGLSPFQKTIAQALQKYGMILGDTGGALSLYAVSRQSFETDPYQGVLPAEDYPDLRKIPVDRFRVLSLPAQQSNPPLKLAPSGCGTFAG